MRRKLEVAKGLIWVPYTNVAWWKSGWED